jgi:hypothetical protein
VPYFVAIISNGQGIAQEVFDVKLPFENGERKVMVKESITHIDIPITAGRTLEDCSAPSASSSPRTGTLEPQQREVGPA